MDTLTSPIYHYTSIAGFLGIVEAKAFHASDIYYMNDAAEISHAAELAESIIKTQKSNGKLPAEIANAFLKALYDSQYAKIFGISFSQERDALSQWRGYGSGAGIAFCFSPQKASKLASFNGMTLVKCVYDLAEQLRFLENLVSTVAEAKSSDVTFENISKIFMKNFCTLASRIKHPAFREENEWRMLSRVFESVYEGSHPEENGYRAGRTTIVPYMKVKLDIDYGEDADKRLDLGFHDVLVGPTQVRELPWRAVMNFLQSKNIKYSQITPSNAPYRGSV